MWPGGGKASDACTTVPTLPRACTGRRTEYLVPGPRHNRAEGQKKSAFAHLCVCWQGRRLETVTRTRAWATPSRQASSQPQNNKIFFFFLYMCTCSVCVCVCVCILYSAGTHKTPMQREL